MNQTVNPEDYEPPPYGDHWPDRFLINGAYVDALNNDWDSVGDSEYDMRRADHSIILRDRDDDTEYTYTITPAIYPVSPPLPIYIAERI